MQVHQNYPLKNYNTFGVEAYANYFASYSTTDDLQLLLKEYSKERILVLGGGSNILFTKDHDGLVLKNDVKGVHIVHEDEDHVYVTAGAGENWHQFVLYCIKHNLAGVENLSLIPGNVGASPMQNIGAYGAEVKDVFHSLEAFHIMERKIKTFTLSDCDFGYRDSVFKKKYIDQFIILNVTYRLDTKPQYNISYGAIKEELEKMGVKELTIQAISQSVINIRNSKLPDPGIIGNAGSFFKNPEVSEHEFHELKRINQNVVGYNLNNGNVKLAAGWLIEQCGWKGYRKGDAGCHERQALVLVNYGNATGKEIYDLSSQVKQSVKVKFNVELEMEVNIF